jgi:hypothetical protein
MQSIERDDVSDNSEDIEDSEEGQFSAGDEPAIHYASDHNSAEKRNGSVFSFPGRRHEKDVKTLGWFGGRSRGFINRYGKKSAAIYRLGDFAFPLQYERDVKDKKKEHEKVSNPENRNGDMKKGGEFVYTKYDMEDIYRVA